MIHFTNVIVGDLSVELPVGSSLLDVDIDHRGVIPFRCKKGICGSCRTEILQGAENMSPPSDEETEFLSRLGHKDGNVRLACQVTVNGPAKIRCCPNYQSNRTLDKRAKQQK